MAGASSWVSVSDQSPTSSSVGQGGATGSFNYAGPQIQFGGQLDTASFWQQRDPGLSLAPATGLQLSPLVLLGLAAVAAFVFFRKR